jgi:hypothetical protein
MLQTSALIISTISTQGALSTAAPDMPGMHAVVRRDSAYVGNYFICRTDKARNERKINRMVEITQICQFYISFKATFSDSRTSKTAEISPAQAGPFSLSSKQKIE